MELQNKVREAVIAELTRQAEASEGRMKAAGAPEGRLRVEGDVDVDALVMAVVGSVAGGP